MKDRQAQLEQNIVAENLGSFFKKIEPYSKLILAGVVALVVVLIAFGLYSSDQSAKRSDATWNLIMENPEVAVKFPNTEPAAWALLFQGNNDLAQGVNSLYQDRDVAETLLTDAKDQFIKAREASKDTIVISRANYGLGMASESLGEINEAIEAYKRTVAADESEQMVKVAQGRIDRLSSADAVDFLIWFGEQDFAPADPSLPPELPGLGALPDLPDLELPDLNLGDEMKATDEPIEGGLQLPDSETEPGKTEGDSKPEPTAGEKAEPAEEPAAEEPAAAKADPEPAKTE